MRDIKFRAWDSDHSVWRYGWLTRLVEGARRFMAVICDDEEGDLVRYYIHNESSIGQYTGWKDVDGVEIYEGDILKGDPEGNIWLVGELLGGFVASDPDDVWDYVLLGDYDFYVIGNIHEHGCLLK